MKKKSTIVKMGAGSAIVLLAIYMIYGTFSVMPEADRWWKNNSIGKDGTVIALRETLRNRVACYYPVIEFTADDGKKYQFSPYDCYSGGAYMLSQQVPVRYKKGDPAQAYIDSGAHATATYAAVYGMSGLMLTAGVLLILSGITKRKARFS